MTRPLAIAASTKRPDLDKESTKSTMEISQGKKEQNKRHVSNYLLMSWDLNKPKSSASAEVTFEREVRFASTIMKVGCSGKALRASSMSMIKSTDKRRLESVCTHLGFPQYGSGNEINCPSNQSDMWDLDVWHLDF